MKVSATLAVADCRESSESLANVKFGEPGKRNEHKKIISFSYRKEKIKFQKQELLIEIFFNLF